MSEAKQIRTIEVVPYDPRWKEEFIRESEVLQGIFDDEVVKVHHVGSTAIPGIHAKPVIDILLEVKDIACIDGYSEAMSSLGYIAKGEGGIPGRRFFLKGEYNRTHHVHVFQTGNSEIARHLNFRDYMIAHPEETRNYEELKKDLAEKFKYDVASYVDGKNAYIQEVDKKAHYWAKTR